MRTRKSDAKDAKISVKEVLHVAKLAKLNLSSQETVKFQKQLSEILEYVALLNKVETGMEQPTSQVTGLENVFREDKPGKTFSQTEALSGGKSKHLGRFKIKAIFE